MNDLIVDELEKEISLSIPGLTQTPVVAFDFPFLNYKNFYLKEEFKSDSFGSGNKTRKLNFIVQDAKMQNATQLIADGIVSSNTCLSVAIACKINSLKSRFILFGPENEGYVDTFQYLGSQVRRFDNWSEQLVCYERENAIKESISNGDQPYIVETGGSSVAGLLGSMHLAREIRIQEEALNINFDVIAFPNGTGGTASGLHIFNEIFNQSRWRLAPISIANNDQIFKSKFEHLWENFSLNRKIFKSLKPYNSFDVPDFLNYNELFNNWKENQEILLVKTGYYFDSIYNLKGILGLQQYLIQMNLPVESNVLYILTGGYNEIIRPQKNRLFI